MGVNDALTIVATAVIAAAILPLLFAWCRGRASHVKLFLGALWLCATVVFVLTVRGYQRPPTTEMDNKERPIMVRDDGYVGSNACRSCHPHNHRTWHESYHRTMTQVATSTSVKAPFDDVELELYGSKFNLERRGDEYWVEMDDPDEPDGTLRRVERRIVMTTGSHHMQAFWYASGNTRVTGMLPFIYLIEDNKWIPRTAAFLRSPGRPKSFSEYERWNRVCIKCHVTDGRGRPDSKGGMDTHVAEFGIACEACHGPGERHVQLNRNPQRRYTYHWNGEADNSIVNPARLSPHLASQVCGQCHSTNEITDLEALEEWRHHGYEYRPGDELSDTRLIIRRDGKPKSDLVRVFYGDLDNSFWSDGMVRVSGREYNGLIETPCHQRGKLSCLSCHTMHKPTTDPRPLSEWRDDQLKTDMDGNHACTQCHSHFRDETTLTEHTHHQASSAGSKCYNCHMPHTTYGLLKAIRSHTIDSPSVQSSLETGRPNACNLCHLDKTLSWTADHLSNWHGVEPPSFTEDERSVAASVLWLLQGDAGQRALVAWNMGWQPAQEASGNGWPGAFLANMLVDPYDAVRYVVHKSLRTLPGFEDFAYDYMAPPDKLKQASTRAWEIWRSRSSPVDLPNTDAVLINRRGMLDDRVWRLVEERDKRRMYLAE